MKKSKKYSVAVALLILLAVVVFFAARGDAERQKGGPKAGAEQETASRSSDDIAYAEQLWEKIEDYTNWPVPEGFEGWQDGISPHGKYLRYYINDIAKEDFNKDGAVIVKENYMEESPDALAAVTIMQKRKGYDPENNDWFYVKYSPDGKVMTDDQGRKIAGAVGKGMDEGCVPCHTTAGGGDYLFMND
ncbi:MAG: cytochrome P460 family protein [Phycisphaerae bacterium]|nr:cytochrome P460 family protein [Phycisphaerae bacterium]